MDERRVIQSRTAASLLIAVAWLSTASAQDLLPGEMPVAFSRELVEPREFPSVRQLMQRLARPEQSSAITFRYYHDQHNHYAPQWSPDGRSFSVLRSDIEAHTSKVLVFPGVAETRPQVLFAESDSYDHMFAWGSRPPTFVFASTNEPSEQENLYLGNPSDVKKTRRLTRGPGVKANPSLWLASNNGRLLFNQSGKICQVDVDADDAREPGEPRQFQDGTEARWSPDGKLFAWVERHDLGGSLASTTLRLRDVQRASDQPLYAQPGSVVRNPAWSPDQRWIAFYARPAQSPAWSLYVVPVPSTRRDGETDSGIMAFATGRNAVQLASDVRIEEHFQNFGPAWSPASDRLWYFGKAADQEYYPLRWTATDGRNGGEVAYPRRLTTGLDVAVHPDASRRSLVFCAIEDLSQDVVALLLAH